MTHYYKTKQFRTYLNIFLLVIYLHLIEHIFQSKYKNIAKKCQLLDLEYVNLIYRVCKSN